MRCFQKPEKIQAELTVSVARKKPLGRVCGPSLLLAAPLNLTGRHSAPQSLSWAVERDLGRALSVPSTRALLKKPLSHPPAIFSAVLISQWPARFQLNEIQAAGLNSSIRLEKCNQMLGSYRAVLSPGREQRLLVSSSEKEEMNAGTWRALTNRSIILQKQQGPAGLAGARAAPAFLQGQASPAAFLAAEQNYLKEHEELNHKLKLGTEPRWNQGSTASMRRNQKLSDCIQ